jgi:5-methylcytosine-specific restriction endonuclease McrA
MELKICSKCKVGKPEGEFRFKRFGQDGVARFRSECRECERATKRSPEAMEAKRARDRERAKREDVKAKRVLAEQAPERVAWKRQYWRDNIKGGKTCFFMLRKCLVCAEVSVLKKMPNGRMRTMCKDCAKTQPLLITKKQVVCRDCGISHYAVRHGARCAQCKHKAERLAHKRQDEKREMLKRGIKSEAIWRSKVFALDGWRCRRCKCKVQKKDIYAANAAELDHIIPLSKGGAHAYDNVQTLCRRCNANKSNNMMPTQLRMVLLT